jgi:hypothetical protein
MINVWPTIKRRGSTLGLARCSAEMETPYCRPILANVSPDRTTCLRVAADAAGRAGVMTVG